jgi:RNA polymerase sigma factor (sigma-70 family)
MTQLNKTEVSELVIRLQTKSTAAFSDLYDSYAAALFGAAIRMVRNRDVAEELLQDSFLKIWEHIDNYDPGKGTLFTWMLAITRNTCKDYLRGKHYQYQMLVSENDFDLMEDNCKRTQITTDQDESRDLYQITQTLELKYKEIIDLVYIYGYTQEEVSKMLKIPLGTVKTRSRTAIKLLRDLYRKHDL